MRSAVQKHNAFVKTRDSLGCLNPPHRRACIAGGPYVPWGWMTRWLWRRCPTRSHSELGRESLQRRWYFVLRHGRVGRCLVFQLHGSRPTGHSSGPACRYRYAGFGFDRGHALWEDTRRTLILFTASPGRIAPGLSEIGAGWSSPVARQAHNLKVAGSNPAPATNLDSLFIMLYDHVYRLV